MQEPIQIGRRYKVNTEFAVAHSWSEPWTRPNQEIQVMRGPDDSSPYYRVFMLQGCRTHNACSRTICNHALSSSMRLGIEEIAEGET